MGNYISYYKWYEIIHHIIKNMKLHILIIKRSDTITVGSFKQSVFFLYIGKKKWEWKFFCLDWRNLMFSSGNFTFLLWYKNDPTIWYDMPILLEFTLAFWNVALFYSWFFFVIEALNNPIGLMRFIVNEKWKKLAYS